MASAARNPGSLRPPPFFGESRMAGHNQRHYIQALEDLLSSIHRDGDASGIPSSDLRGIRRLLTGEDFAHEPTEPPQPQPQGPSLLKSLTQEMHALNGPGWSPRREEALYTHPVLTRLSLELTLANIKRAHKERIEAEAAAEVAAIARAKKLT